MSGIIFALILTYVAFLAGVFGHVLGYVRASNKLRPELREAWAERDKQILLRKLRVPYGEEDKE
ncbi:hypothetical protein I5F56_00290 [Pseudomonas aeruginosa]|nr:hypothetical protein [Pseudomonas aeruginosa]